MTVPRLQPPLPRPAGAPLALAGIRIADFSRLIAGPWATMMLADLGAEVIKIEQPGIGDESRYLTPTRDGMSSVFITMNRNKRSIVLDLKSDSGRAVAADLIASSDVLVENFSIGVMERMGLGYEQLKDRHPRLIYAYATAFGRAGQYADRPGYDPVTQADSGLFSLNGYPDRPPVRSMAPVVDVGSGMCLLNAIFAALLARHATGLGQRVEVALFDVAVALTGNYAMNYLLTGVSPQRQGNGSVISHPTGLFSASDGDFYLTCSSDRLFRKLATQVIGRPDLLERPEYATNDARVRNVATLTPLLGEIFRQRPCAYWVERLLAAGVPAGPVRSIAEAMDSPEARDRALLSTLPHPAAGSVPNIGAPFRLEGTPAVDPRAAPVLGADTRAVLATDLGYDAARIDALARDGAFGDQPV